MVFTLGKAAATFVAALGLGHAQQDPVTEPAAPPAPAVQQSKNFLNPQISLATDFRWNAINDDPSIRKRAFLKEAELGFAADVDPFLRAEAYIAFADEDGETVAEVEEAFGRYWNLGKGMSAKFGKIAAAIGRVQRNHADQLNWLDYPLMVQDFLGDEGLRSGGASLSYLLPGERFNEFTFEALQANDKGIFSREGGGGGPVVVGTYRTFFDFNEDSSAQVGFTYANGPGGVGNQRSQLFAAEFTYKMRPGAQSRSLDFEAEAYLGRPGGSSDSKFGGFAALTYQLRSRLYGYLKYDYSEAPYSNDIRKGFSAGVTLAPTEFHRWRVEWQRIDANFATTRNALNVQFQWLIGSHPAHRY